MVRQSLTGAHRPGTLDRWLAAAHRYLVCYGLRVPLTTEQVRSLQLSLGLEPAGRYCLATAQAVKKLQERLKAQGSYKGGVDGLWNAQLERYTSSLRTEILKEGKTPAGPLLSHTDIPSGTVVGDYTAMLPENIRGELPYEGWVWLVREVSRHGATPEQFREIVSNLSREWRYTEKWEEWQRDVKEYAAAHPEIKPFIEEFKEQQFWFELKSFLALATMPIPFVGGITAVGLVEGKVEPWEVIPGYSIGKAIVKVVEYAAGKTDADDVINSLIDAGSDAVMILIFRGSKPKKRFVSKWSKRKEAIVHESSYVHWKGEWAHGNKIFEEVEKMRYRWKYAEIYVNKSLTRATEGKAVSKWRIDIVAKTRMGKYDVIEVINTQSEADARARLKEVVGWLGEFAGKYEVIQAK